MIPYQRTVIVAALLFAASATPNFASAIAVSGQGTWESTLQGRDFDLNLATIEAYYDTALDITWLADANYALTSGYDNDGKMTWSTANAWASGLEFYGLTGWRLPTIIDIGYPGCTFSNRGDADCGYNVDTATGEMAHLYYVTLGNLAYESTSGRPNQPGWGLTNTGPFSNIQQFIYWSSTEYAPHTTDAWGSGFTTGIQREYAKTTTSYAWAVHSGDWGMPINASMVPVPAAAWLFGSGLLGMIGFSLRKKLS